jgi:hypothetical protein
MSASLGSSDHFLIDVALGRGLLRRQWSRQKLTGLEMYRHLLADTRKKLRMVNPDQLDG